MRATSFILLCALALALGSGGCSSTAQPEPLPATVTQGVQRATVLINRGYSPNIVKVQKGKPVELTFRAGENLGCGETIVFKTLSQTKTVKKGESVTFTFTPDEAGDIPFSCSMDMYRGKVVVQ